jgi:hypothetical protein
MRITHQNLRKIIREELRILEYGPGGGNPPPPRDSNWRAFADAIDVGTLDLDELAYELGFRDFVDMDISISPRSLADRDSRKFVQAVQDTSMMAQDMSPDEILTHANATGGI